MVGHPFWGDVCGASGDEKSGDGSDELYGQILESGVYAVAAVLP